jgi:hypothetical protein
MRRAALVLLGLLSLPLAGCDLLGIEGASAVAARREAEGKAIGGACRHAARSIEQCYASNKRADKAAVFAGWREMNDYMRENQIEAMPAPAQPPAAERGESEERDERGESREGNEGGQGSKRGDSGNTEGKGGAPGKGAAKADAGMPAAPPAAKTAAAAKTTR